MDALILPIDVQLREDHRPLCMHRRIGDLQNTFGLSLTSEGQSDPYHLQDASAL